MHLSKAPAGQDVSTYDGSGEWVKIHTSGLRIDKTLPNPVVWAANNNGGDPARVSAQLPFPSFTICICITD
jgi:hypothetical protein